MDKETEKDMKNIDKKFDGLNVNILDIKEFISDLIGFFSKNPKIERKFREFLSDKSLMKQKYLKGKNNTSQ